MTKRTKLTKTRAEAVDKFAAALINEARGVNGIIDFDRFLVDYKKGNVMNPGAYAIVKEIVAPVKKKKVSFWKRLFGME